MAGYENQMQSYAGQSQPPEISKTQGLYEHMSNLLQQTEVLADRLRKAADSIIGFRPSPVPTPVGSANVEPRPHLSMMLQRISKNVSQANEEIMRLEQSL